MPYLVHLGVGIMSQSPQNSVHPPSPATAETSGGVPKMARPKKGGSPTPEQLAILRRAQQNAGVVYSERGNHS